MYHGTTIARTTSAPGTSINRFNLRVAARSSSQIRQTSAGSTTAMGPFRERAEADRDVHQQQQVAPPLGMPLGEHEERERERHEQRDVDVDEDAPREKDDARRGGDDERGQHAGRGRRSARPDDRTPRR